MVTLFEQSTYRHEYTVVDSDTGDAKDLTDADVRYLMTTERPGTDGGETIFDLTDADGEVSIDDAQAGEVTVELPAEDVVAGRMWEELRVSFPDASQVVDQQQTRFKDTATSAP